jgi:hypothetical protein
MVSADWGAAGTEVMCSDTLGLLPWHGSTYLPLEGMFSYVRIALLISALGPYRHLVHV